MGDAGFLSSAVGLASRGPFRAQRDLGGHIFRGPLRSLLKRPQRDVGPNLKVPLKEPQRDMGPYFKGVLRGCPLRELDPSSKYPGPPINQ